MAEAERLADEDVAVAKMGVVVKVAAAEARGGDVYLNFISRRWGDCACFLRVGGQSLLFFSS